MMNKTPNITSTFITFIGDRFVLHNKKLHKLYPVPLDKSYFYIEILCSTCSLNMECVSMKRFSGKSICNRYELCHFRAVKSSLFINLIIMSKIK